MDVAAIAEEEAFGGCRFDLAEGGDAVLSRVGDHSGSSS
jgi:hypothetical protein